MKRWFPLVMVVLLVIGLLSGCGGTDTSTGENESSGQGEGTGGTKKDVTLSQMVSQGWTSDADEAISKKFTEETGITIDWQVTPADQYHDLLKTKLNAGEAPDIFWIQTNPFAIKTEIDPEKNCIDFSDEEWVRVMNLARLPAVSYNDKVYGLMLWPNSPEYVFVYNKTLFEELGITNPPTTYEEFKKDCGIILDKGITPIYEYVAAGWHHVLPFAQIGGRYEELHPGLYDELNNNKIKYADVPEMELALSQMKEFADLGYYGDDYMANTGEDAQERMATRKAAMLTANPGDIKQIKDDYPDCKDEFGLFLIPFVDNQTFPFNPNGPARFAYKNSKYVDEIKEYFNYITNKENLQYKLDNTPGMTNLDVTVDIEQHWLPQELELMDKIPKEKYITVLQSAVKYTNEQWMEIGKDIEGMYMNAMTPKQILENIDERRAKMAKAQGDPAWAQ
ncbi:ABC transporter substrate-binding protein [Mahella australiensis]|uniref:Extracellular solute-binding protein family 1 n=1 Tax=Mahella australiensis (strain DSM 15567 / CIP 107919 / 50-1 BON) TaxID=697281 RepID=F3ZY50_MAHA5|nr:ABC transporter substrate-binding protein [Mahella australiensis]AEE97746.1 extracellular solute-binding protein family 1 [Mahella australiensis 50-1 BON]